MRLHARRALTVVVIGVIALFVVPARSRVGATGASERQYAPQLAAVSLSTADAPLPTPRVRPIDLSFIGVLFTAAFSIAVAWRAMRRLSPHHVRGVRAIGYGRRRGPPLAQA